jgi:hypothetical protein
VAMRRRRVRTWAKWACTVAAGLAVSVAVASRWYGAVWVDIREDCDRHLDIEIRGGVIAVTVTRIPPLPGFPGVSYLQLGRGPQPSFGLSSSIWSPRSQSMWRAGLLHCSSQYGWQAGATLLYPVLLTTIPAAFLWYKDRRRSGPHTCPNCNYDRRGLPADANCPECGTVPARG